MVFIDLYSYELVERSWIWVVKKASKCLDVYLLMTLIGIHLSLFTKKKNSKRVLQTDIKNGTFFFFLPKSYCFNENIKKKMCHMGKGNLKLHKIVN